MQIVNMATKPPHTGRVERDTCEKGREIVRRRTKLRSESRSEKGVERDTSEKGNNWESK